MYARAGFYAIVEGVRKLEGLSASRGIAIGPVFCFPDEDTAEISRYPINGEAVDAEWSLFDTALETSRREITLLLDDRNREQSEILNAHLLMLSDPEFIPRIKRDLETRLLNVEAVLQDAVEESSGILRSTGDAYLAERAVDIEDAFGRVMSHVAALRHGTQGKGLKRSSTTTFIPPGTILVARNLKPSQALSLKDSGISGIILEEGGATSHVAILARSWRIPAVMGVRSFASQVEDGQTVILDADNGLVIVSPTTGQLSAYRVQSAAPGESGKEKETRIRAPSVTRDGARMVLRANIALAAEAEDAIAEGAEGVGLFRSEFLFMGSLNLPDEETQLASYLEAARLLKDTPLVIRTLDAGGDKMIGEQLSLTEKNPLLGWRAIRFCLDRRELFSAQLRAILRASAEGDVRIMFPMISNVEELDAALDVLEEAKNECERRGQAYNRRIKTGIMIETPAAAVCADLLAKKADFMSIGTNDLIQYTMACDRENTLVAHLYDGFNPAVLRMIQKTIDAGTQTHTDVSMCGEMAGDAASVFLLMGMGLRNFSMASSRISAVKELIRRASLADAVECAEAAMELSAAREIRKLVQERLKTYE